MSRMVTSESTQPCRPLHFLGAAFKKGDTAMSGSFKPISPRPVDGIQFHPDVAHGPYPDHMDVRTVFGDGLANKLRIDGTGNILSDQIEFGRRFLRDV